jgi:hypothetical protein
MPANFSIITRGRLAQVQANDKPILIYATFPSVRIGAEDRRGAGRLPSGGVR